MSSYPVIKGNSIERKMLIRTSNKQFLLVVREDNDNVSLYIGGKDKYYMYAQIIKERSQLRTFTDVAVGMLSSIEKDEACAINTKLERGDGTKLLVYILTSYIAKNYPHVKLLKLTDTSTIVCDNGRTISLSEMNYIVYGRTWYQRTFNAYIDDKYIERFEKADAKFQVLKQSMSWSLFFSIANNPVCNTEWENLYNSAKTWPDFFGPIYNKIGSHSFCDIFSPVWISNFIERYSDVRIAWIPYLLPIQQKSIQYTVEPYSAGGNKRRSPYRRAKHIFMH